MADAPPMPTPGERVGEPTDSAGQPQPTAVDERVHPDTTTDMAPEEACTNRPPQAQEAANVPASIFDEPATIAGQGEPADGKPRDDESFDAFMVSCRDGAPAAGPRPPSPPSRVTPHREPTDPTWDPPEGPASASRQAHLHRNYATLGMTATGHTTTTDDGYVGGNRTETTSRTPTVPPSPAHGAMGPLRRRPPPRPASQLAGHLRGRRHPGDRKTWTTRTPKGTPTAPARKRDAQQPATWICGSPEPPTWSSSPLQSGPGGCSRISTISGTEPGPWWTSSLATRRGRKPHRPPRSTPASGAMWPPALWHTWGPIALTT